MKRLVKRISLPLLLLVGLTMIGPEAAEAARWRPYGWRGYVPYVAPRAVYGPRVQVNAPRVDVRVGPGVDVYAPAARVRVGTRRAYRYGW